MEVKYGSDPLVATDINRELNYVKNRMEELGTAQTTFTEGGRRSREHYRTIREHRRSKRQLCGGSQRFTSRCARCIQ